MPGLACNSGVNSEMKLSLIICKYEDWYIAISSNRADPGYSFLNQPYESTLNQTNQLREEIGLRIMELRDKLVDVEHGTGMNLNLPDPPSQPKNPWVEKPAGGKITVVVPPFSSSPPPSFFIIIFFLNSTRFFPNRIFNTMRTKLSLLLVVLGLLFGCHQKKTDDISNIHKGMIHTATLYPNGEGKTFDMDYYLNKHIPFLKSLVGDSVKLISIDRGLSNNSLDSPVLYLAIGHMYFESMSALQNSMTPEVIEKLMADTPNYTNIQAIVQISVVEE